tara:strand:- start:464 stop:721 length:258 start_codon:yes stop_codon:yes gene_type:complete
MSEIIQKIFSKFFLFFVLTLSLFTKAAPSFSAQMDSDMNMDNSLGIVIEQSNDDLEKSETSAVPDLGDDQAFPFIPGFGKNSGKD